MRANTAVLTAVVRSRAPILAAVTGVALLLALAYAWLAPDRFRATVTLFVEPAAGAGGAADAGAAAARSSDLDLLRSERVALRVAQNEHLAEEPSLRPLYLQAVESGRQPLDVLAQAVADRAEAVAGGEGGVVQLSVTMDDAPLAARIANAYAAAWGEVTLELRAASIRDGVERAHRDLMALRARLGQAQARLHGTDDVAAVAGANARFAELARFASRPMPRGVPSTGPAEEAPGPHLASLRTDGSATIASAPSPVTPTNAFDPPAVRSDTTGPTAATLLNLGPGAAPAVRPPVEAAEGSADDDIRIAQRSLERAEDRLARMAVEGIGAASPIHVLMAARVPERSEKPGVLASCAIGIAAGLLLGLLATLLVEVFDRRVRGANDVARGLGVVVLGQVPRTRAAAVALALPDPHWGRTPRSTQAG